MRVALGFLAFLSVALLLACAPSQSDDERPASTNPDGRWTWLSSQGGMLDDTIAAREAVRLLLLRDGIFILKDEVARDSVSGTYTVRRIDDPGYGDVDAIEFSTRIPLFDEDSIFVLQISGDTLILINPWADAWSHRFRRLSR